MTKDAVTIQTPEDIRLQKYRFSLLCSGNAMILFAVWSVIRSIIQFHFQTDAVVSDSLLNSIILPLLAAGIADVILKLFIGFSARAEALGKRKRSVYIVLGIILAILTLLSMLYWISLFPVLYETNELLSVIVSIAVEITVFIAELDLVISAIKARKIENETDQKMSEEGRA